LKWVNFNESLVLRQKESIRVNIFQQMYVATEGEKIFYVSGKFIPQSGVLLKLQQTSTLQGVNHG